MPPAIRFLFLLMYMTTMDQHFSSTCTQDPVIVSSFIVLTEHRESKKQSDVVKSALHVKNKASLTACSKERLIATVQKQRVVCKQLQSQVDDMKMDIKMNSIKVDETLENDMLNILKGNDLKSSPHMNLFWQQQKKLLASPNFGRQYHPHLIRFCLSLHSKSPSAYRELASCVGVAK